MCERSGFTSDSMCIVLTDTLSPLRHDLLKPDRHKTPLSSYLCNVEQGNTNRSRLGVEECTRFTQLDTGRRNLSRTKQLTTIPVL